MRPLLAGLLLVPVAGCVSLGPSAATLASGARGPDVPPAVIRTPEEFEHFLTRARASGAKELAEQLAAGRPDFDRQALVLIRHDSNSDSRYGFRATERRGALVCDIETQRRGTLRDYCPRWFAVAVERPGPERVEVRVDGTPQEGAERR